MKQAVQQGKTSAPADLRYLKKPHSKVDQSQRSSVVSFLGHLYNSVAETLPDFRDDVESAKADVEQVAVNQGSDDEDAYGDLIQVRAESANESQAKRSKERRMRGCVELNVARKPGVGGQETRYLPPGQMKDMWEQYRLGLQNSTTKPASFSLFWRELWLHSFLLKNDFW